MFRAFYVGTTQTKTLTLNSIVMVASNILFNWILIFGKFGCPALGITGAAIGSSLAELVSLIFFAAYTYIRCDRKKYGLDKPLIVQLKNYLVNYCKGDLGVSLKMQEGTPVKDILFRQGKFGLSMRLGLLAVLVAVVLGIPLGCLAAYKRGTWVDGLLRVLTTVGVAIPTFVLAATLLIYLGVKAQILPVLSGSLTNWKAYIMPVISLSFYDVCYIAKLTRTSMLDAINQDYIRTARAKGVKNKWIVLKHALRNSLIPVVTFLGPLIAFIITGSFVVETTFSIPGLGKYFVESVINRDYTVIMATTFVVSILVIGMNLVVDIVYKVIDPRITLSSTDE
jgi:oligopeptide transport system permease protein